MNKEFYTKHSGWLIPALCVLVIFQTVMLFNDSVRQKVGLITQIPNNQAHVTPTVTPTAAKIELVPQSLTVIKGKTVKVEVWLRPERLLTLGGMDLVLKFDPKLAGVSKIETGKEFSLVIPNRLSEKNGRSFITYLDEGGQGVKISEPVKLADLTLITKQAGKLELSVISNSEGATTVLAENVSNNSLPFTASNLTIMIAEK